MKRWRLLRHGLWCVVLALTVAMAVAQETTPTSGKISDLLGKSVENFQGEDLGRITDILTGPMAASVLPSSGIGYLTTRKNRLLFPLADCLARKSMCSRHEQGDVGFGTPFVLEEDFG